MNTGFMQLVVKMKEFEGICTSVLYKTDVLQILRRQKLMTENKDLISFTFEFRNSNQNRERVDPATWIDSRYEKRGWGAGDTLWEGKCRFK